MLLKSALKNIRKNSAMNLITFAQMAAALFVVGVMVSAVCLRFQTYLPFRDYFEGNGIYCNFGDGASKGDALSDPHNYICDTNQLKSLIQSESVLAVHKTIILPRMTFAYPNFQDQDPNGPEGFVQGYTYDDGFIQRYIPPIQEGRWLDTDATELEVVISENNWGWKTGDVIEFGIGSWDGEHPIKAHIVGMLKEGVEVVGLFRDRKGADTYKNLYCPYSFETDQYVLMLMSYSVMNRLHPDCFQPISSVALFKYPDDMSDEAIQEKREQITKLGALVSSPMKQLNAESWKYLYEQVYQLTPILAVLMILVLVSSVASSALSTRRSLHDYAKFYILGLQWKQCALINLLQSAVIGAAALVFAVLGFFVIQYTPLSETFFIIWNGWLVLAMAVLLVLYMLFSMVMPLAMMHAATPKELLQTE